MGTRSCRRSLAVLAGALVLTLVVLQGCKKEAAPAAAPLEVRVAEAVQRDVPIYREWVGQLYGSVDIEIRARVSGWLEGMYFTEGSDVKKGALLYRIDQSELQEAVAQARGRLAQARTLMIRAQSDVQRYRPLAEAGAVSQRDLESAEAEYGARQGEVEAAQAELKVAEINLSYATIYAPINGLIGISAARVGEFVGRVPNPIILNTISRVDSVRVRFSIAEQEYLDLARRLGQERAAAPRQGRLEMVLADGSVYPERGTLLFLQRQVDAATGTIQIEASFPNSRKFLRPGQFARVRAVYDERKSAVLVPARAIMEIQGQSVLYTLGSEDRAQFRRIVPGPKMGTLQVVEQGVEAGEKVIVDGIQRVRPDMVVKATVIPPDSLEPATGGGGR